MFFALSPTSLPRSLALSARPLSRSPHPDFFSGSGSSYVIGKAVNTEDDDWDF